MKRFLTKAEILRIYEDNQAGRNPAMIARDLLLTTGHVYQVIKRINGYLNGTPLPTGKHSKNINYNYAVLELQGSKPVVETMMQPIDPFQKLDGAFNKFMEALQEFVDLQVGKKVKEKQDYIEKLEEENRVLKGTIEKAKTSNWISTLKNRWGN